MTKSNQDHVVQADEDPAVNKRSRLDGRFSITVTLTVAIGLLVFISVGSVLWVGLWSAQKNTFDLLSQNVNQGIYSAINRVRQHLQPAEFQTKYLVEQIEEGNLDLANREQMRVMLTGALAAAPQITAVIYIDPKLQQFGVGFNPVTDRLEVFEGDLSHDEQVLAATSSNNPNPVWGPPIWQEDLQTAYLNRIHPIITSRGFQGVMVSVVPIRNLSDFVTEQDAQNGGHSFILYGKDSVLAHANLVAGYPGRTEISPLPDLSTFNDRVLAAIWSNEHRQDLAMQLHPGTKGHQIELNDEFYIFVYRSVPGFGSKPFVVGSYYNRSEVGDEVRRLIFSLAAGVAALLLSLVAAILVGRHIAKPIVRFSEAAVKVRDLEISKVQNLPGSIFRELNNQSIAFNAMLRALRWFELYVPRKIVASLIRQGDMKENISDDRVVTIMFTDMVGFSTISQGMSAAQVAKLMNEHFALVVGCIEAEDGTVDKFIGDSVMAFWGAPELQKGHAEKACRAALGIAKAIQDDNKRRRQAGLAAIGIRIGVHTGKATVGNIGAPDRLNYTILGDSVNIGQRLEQLGKQIPGEGQDVTILISDATAKEIGDEFNAMSAGRHKLKGRTGELDVFQLI